MLNTSQEVLAEVARRILNQCAARDPELSLYTRDYQTLWESFCRRHRRNGTLTGAVGDLLDAQSVVHEVRGEYQFFLGFQMGLELGGMDIFQKL